MIANITLNFIIIQGQSERAYAKKPKSVRNRGKWGNNLKRKFGLNMKYLNFILALFLFLKYKRIQRQLWQVGQNWLKLLFKITCWKCLLTGLGKFAKPFRFQIFLTKNKLTWKDEVVPWKRALLHPFWKEAAVTEMAKFRVLRRSGRWC